MQDAHQHRKARIELRLGHAQYAPYSALTALGFFGSPSRRVNETEYAAERALSSGSSEPLMPLGSTSGPKLRSRAGLTASPCKRSRVRVPTSMTCRSAGQGSVASAVGSPAWPTVTS